MLNQINDTDYNLVNMFPLKFLNLIKRYTFYK